MTMKPSIITERLVLRAIENSDLEAMVDILMNEQVKETYMLPDFMSRQDAYPLFRKLHDLSNDPERYVFGIALNGQIIGFMNDVEMKNGTIEVGYVIHPRYHNLGYATEGLVALIDHLHFKGFHTVVAGFFEGNLASRRVMEKAGMTQTEQIDEIEYRGQMHRCIYFEHKSV